MKKALICSIFALTAVTAGPTLARPMTETDLATMKRLSAPAASPDGKEIAYVVQETDLKANKRRSDIFIKRIDGTLTEFSFASQPGSNETDPAFSNDGKFLYFLSNRTGSHDSLKLRRPGNPRSS